MKVNSSEIYRAYTQNKNTQTTPQESRSADDRTEKASANTDKVTISSNAIFKNEVGKVARTFAAETENLGSAAKISRLKQAVAAGTYSVPAEKIASAMLDALA